MHFATILLQATLVQEDLQQQHLHVLRSAGMDFEKDQKLVMIIIQTIMMVAQTYVQLSQDGRVMETNHQSVNRYAVMAKTCQQKFVTMETYQVWINVKQIALVL